MPAPSPIYTLDNCRPAYQLNWGLSIFWHQPPCAAEWLDALQTATEPDGVRVLEHRFVGEKMSQFLVSTKPAVSPHALVRSVKGRLQYRVRGERPKAFPRNYCLRSVGSVTREGDHAIYWSNLHVEIAVRFMNNLAYRDGMKRMFEFGYYVGTFGEYDLGAIPRA